MKRNASWFLGRSLDHNKGLWYNKVLLSQLCLDFCVILQQVDVIHKIMQFSYKIISYWNEKNNLFMISNAPSMQVQVHQTARSSNCFTV